jgi:hypothetical protein
LFLDFHDLYLKHNFGFWGSAALYVAEKEGRSHSGCNGRGVEHDAIPLEGTMWLRRRFGGKEVKPDITHLSTNFHG